tara:strand:- start:62 stop:472 length:411 start_codon:yes stop_codon:yes gene_type:complete
MAYFDWRAIPCVESAYASSLDQYIGSLSQRYPYVLLYRGFASLLHRYVSHCAISFSLSLLDFLFCFTGAELDLICFSSPALAFGCRSLGDRSHPQIEHVGVPIGMTPAQSGQFFALAICSLFFDAALVGFSDQAWS